MYVPEYETDKDYCGKKWLPTYFMHAAGRPILVEACRKKIYYMYKGLEYIFLMFFPVCYVIYLFSGKNKQSSFI